MFLKEDPGCHSNKMKFWCCSLRKLIHQLSQNLLYGKEKYKELGSIEASKVNELTWSEWLTHGTQDHNNNQM